MFFLFHIRNGQLFIVLIKLSEHNENFLFFLSDFSKIRTGSASDIGSISSLTPSVVHSPTKGQTFSPTGTPLNSPEHSRPHSPTRKNSPPTLEDNPGYVLGFFAR